MLKYGQRPIQLPDFLFISRGRSQQGACTFRISIRLHRLHTWRNAGSHKISTAPHRSYQHQSEQAGHKHVSGQLQRHHTCPAKPFCGFRRICDVRTHKRRSVRTRCKPVSAFQLIVQRKTGIGERRRLRQRHALERLIQNIGAKRAKSGDQKRLIESTQHTGQARLYQLKRRQRKQHNACGEADLLHHAGKTHSCCYCSQQSRNSFTIFHDGSDCIAGSVGRRRTAPRSAVRRHALSDSGNMDRKNASEEGIHEDDAGQIPGVPVVRAGSYLSEPGTGCGPSAHRVHPRQ